MKRYLLLILFVVISLLYVFYDCSTIDLLSLRMNLWIQMLCAAFIFASTGAILQILLHNPLADPWLLGVSGMSSVGVVIASLISPFVFLRTIFALGGSMLVILFLVVHVVQKKQFQIERFVLIGIGINALSSALIFFLQSVFAPNDFFVSLARISGHISARSLFERSFLIVSLIIMLIFLHYRQKELSILRSGTLLAQTIGLPVDRIKFEGILVSSIALSLAVSIVGSIGFIGLATPHLISMILGDKEVLNPLSLFSVSGILMLCAALLVRVLPVGSFVPIGTAMALIGAPIFIMILVRQQ